ncbi:MAG: glycosyltransferase, partial [Bacteroidota bacterium]
LLENKGLNYYYSLANKTFDYIQQEIPAIHMAFPEYQSINQEFEVALLIENLEEEHLFGAIQQLLEDESLYHTLKTNCRLAKQQYTWEREALKLKTFYQKLCPDITE